MSGKIKIVVGGEHGSEGKGHVAAQLAARSAVPLTIRTGGPNAGHSVLDDDGVVYKLRQLPTAVISNPAGDLAIGAGSLVDPVVLEKELLEVGFRINHAHPLIIDPAATVLEQHHIDQERGDSGLKNWSTQKGIGAARAGRIMRVAKTARDWDWGELPVVLADVSYMADRQLSAGLDVIIEGAQGYGLGLHTRFYPKTTSADCRAVDALADCGISPWKTSSTPEVWVVVRPNPIRVAGESGELKGETSWELLGQEPERTTVTNKIRRVGAWDRDLVEEAVRANGGPSPHVRVALTMVDKIIPELAGMTDREQTNELSGPALEKMLWWRQEIWACGARVGAIGTGPATMVFYPEEVDD